MRRLRTITSLLLGGALLVPMLACCKLFPGWTGAVVSLPR